MESDVLAHPFQAVEKVQRRPDCPDPFFLGDFFIYFFQEIPLDRAPVERDLQAGLVRP